MELLNFLKEWAGLLNFAVFPAIWWASSITGKVDRLHGAFSTLQTLRSKVAVLEERTGGEVKVARAEP